MAATGISPIDSAFDTIKERTGIMQVFSTSEVTKKLHELDGWYLDKDAIRKDWTFRDFSAALAFINKIGELAEKHDHHPELYNVYNKVSLRFNTHSASGITEKDFSIAGEIDRIH